MCVLFLFLFSFFSLSFSFSFSPKKMENIIECILRHRELQYVIAVPLIAFSSCVFGFIPVYGALLFVAVWQWLRHDMDWQDRYFFFLFFLFFFVFFFFFFFSFSFSYLSPQKIRNAI